jgi:Fe-S-cluster containining protein
MRCSHCGVCCQETEMPLSDEDVRLLEKTGYPKEKFARRDERGYLLLRNKRGHCFFYDMTKRLCSVYSIRPQGCRTYPVVCTDENTVLVDDLCPRKRTVSEKELRRKGEEVLKLVQKIDSQAKLRSCRKD